MIEWFTRLLGRTRSAAARRGARGERLAAAFLQRERGFAVVARNWRAPRDRRAEIDLVCRDGPVLVFVEVKTRVAGARVSGYFAVTARKRRALRRACGIYLAALGPTPRTYRFDIVEVALPADGQPGTPEVRHFSGIPLFSRHRWG